MENVHNQAFYHKEMGDCYLGLNRPDDALKEYEKASGIAKVHLVQLYEGIGDAQVLLALRAETSSEQGLWQKAQDAYNQAINPQNIDHTALHHWESIHGKLFCKRAMVLTKLRAFSSVENTREAAKDFALQAEKDLKKTLKNHPKLLMGWFTYLRLLLDLEEWGKLCTTSSEMIIRAPSEQHALAYFYLGEYHRHLTAVAAEQRKNRPSEEQKALELYGKGLAALASMGENVDIVLRDDFPTFILQRFDPTLLGPQTAQGEQDSLRLWLMLGQVQVYYFQGDWEKCQRRCEEMIKFSQSPSARYYCASARYRMQNKRPDLNILSEMAAIYPDFRVHRRARAHYAEILRAAGDEKKALEVENDHP